MRIDQSHWMQVEAVLAQRLYHPVTQDLFVRLDAAADAAPPDVVHVHGSRLGQWWVLQWAAARGLPTMYTEHVTHGVGSANGEHVVLGLSVTPQDILSHRRSLQRFRNAWTRWPVIRH